MDKPIDLFPRTAFSTAGCREHGWAQVELRHRLNTVLLKRRGDRVPWSVKVTEEYAAWFTALIKDDLNSATQVAQAVAALREEGPTLGRPLVDRVQGSQIHHLKELRPARRAGRRSGCCLRSIPPGQPAAARRRQGGELAAVVPGEHPHRRTAVPGVHKRIKRSRHA
jgi:hypothetical protein